MDSIVVGEIDTSRNNGDVSLVAPGNVRTGSISTGEPRSGIDSGTVSITSGGSVMITTEQGIPASITTPQQSITVTAGGSILTGPLNTSNFSGSSSVKLLAEAGDIQVGSIDAGSGGIDVTAAGSFRVTDSFFSALQPNRLQDFMLDDPSTAADLIDFLVAKGHDRDEILEGNVFISPKYWVSLFARPDINNRSLENESNAPITIKYGGATEEIINLEFAIIGNSGPTPVESRGLISIRGDSSQSLTIGPERIDFIPDPTDIILNPDNPEMILERNFEPYNSGNPLGFNPSDPFDITMIDDDAQGQSNNNVEATPPNLPSDIFSTNASGLAASIIVGTGGNTDMHGSLQSRVFGGAPEDPVIDDPVVDDPVIDDPVTDNPIINDPVVDDPIVEDPVVDVPDSAEVATREDVPVETQNLETEESRNLCEDRREEVLPFDRLLTIDASILNDVQHLTSPALIDPCNTRSPIDDADNLSEVIDDSDVELPE